MNAAIVLLVLTLAWSVSSHPTSDTYSAAVFEHAPLGNINTETLQDIVKQNLDVYALAVQTAAEQGADIIVFPDYGLLPKLKVRERNKEVLEAIPSPDESDPPHPCNQAENFQDRPILKTLSCLARDNTIVVVAGMGAIEPCTLEDDPKCPSDEAYHLNAHVAFGKDGALIARYYKDHLFFERAYNVPPVSQQSIFRTDFGKFAIVSSFDILFKNAVDAVEEHQVENVVFPVMWFDELPFFTSIQFEESWALRMGVNLLAANVNIPHRGSLGSGIYSGNQGAVRYTYNQDGLSKLLIAKIPRTPGQPVSEDQPPILIINNGKVEESQEPDGSKVPEMCSEQVLGTSRTEYRCKERDFSNFSLRKFVKSEDTLEACSNTTCCTVDYKIDSDSLDEDYYLAVYNGIFTLMDKYHLCAQVCSVVRCNAIDGKECSSFPMRSNTIFRQLTLTGNFDTPYVFPSMVKSGQRLGPARKWDFNVDRDKSNLHSEQVSDPLLFASIFGRCFHNDPPYRP